MYACLYVGLCDSVIRFEGVAHHFDRVNGQFVGEDLDVSSHSSF